MLKFSFGLPRKSVKRITAQPQVSDLQQMLTAAMEDSDKDVGISWTQSNLEFKLVVRHRGSQLLWRLLFGSGLAQQVIWSTNETNMRTVYAQLIARCNDQVAAADGSDEHDNGGERAEEEPAGRNDVSAIQKALAVLKPGRDAARNTSSGLPKLSSTGRAAAKPSQTNQQTEARPAIVLEDWHKAGDLNCVRIHYLLQCLCDEKASGRLTIVGVEDVAEVYFYYGSIVHGKAGNSTGMDTVMEVMCWESGRYEFDQTAFAEEGTISAPFPKLMKYDRELLSIAGTLEEKGLSPSSFICRQRTRLGEAALEELMQESVALKRIYLTTTEPLSVGDLIERVRLPRAQFIPALSGLLESGLLTFWNEESADDHGRLSSLAGGSSKQSQGLERFAFQQLIRAKPDAHEDLWIQALATPGGINKIPLPTKTSIETKPEDISEEIKQFAKATFDYLQSYTSLFNRYIVDAELAVTTTELGEIQEHNAPPSRLPPGQYQPPQDPLKYWRFRSSTTMWSLNCRARADVMEFFLVPASESVRLSEAEQEYRRRFKLERKATRDATLWIADGLPVMPSDIRMFVRSCFRDLVRTTITDLQFAELGYDDQMVLVTEAGQGGSNYAFHNMKQILFEKQNLAQKIVSQQEEIQRRIARDLHDAVIADVTMLKRSLDGPKESRPNRTDTVKSLEQISQRLREICYDLSPSDLRDWGLPTTIEALLDHVSQRTGAECELVCQSEIPVLEGAVELHIFRIIQEALNNSAKYSDAKYISVITDVQNGWLLFRVEDDGKGFDQAQRMAKATKEGGFGMGSMLERTQLIQCFYPAKLETKSQPGHGTTTRLSIKLPASIIAQLSGNVPRGGSGGEVI